ncbi:hypothetical protein HPB50_000387 [Hyalomma asiaticum]|uniref:Uncharacterized protein n=1 Tax=Hyalomma asiaticum TaxID=266040 RepID=A0ACB7SDD2_HYAAI|nr:hypothetical protein HPB50_000387 [Hyalomma asiaticum]
MAARRKRDNIGEAVFQRPRHGLFSKQTQADDAAAPAGLPRRRPEMDSTLDGLLLSAHAQRRASAWPIGASQNQRITASFIGLNLGRPGSVPMLLG